MPIHKPTCFWGSTGVIISGGIAGGYVAAVNGTAVQILLASVTGGVSGLMVGALSVIIYYKFKLRASGGHSPTQRRDISQSFEMAPLSPMRTYHISPSSSLRVIVLSQPNEESDAIIQHSDNARDSPRASIQKPK